jgi:hypothetical protein
MTSNQLVGLVASRQIAINRGKSEDEALRDGIIGYVAPVAGIALAATSEPAVEPPRRPRPEVPRGNGAPAGGGAKPAGETATVTVKAELKDAFEALAAAASAAVDQLHGKAVEDVSAALQHWAEELKALAPEGETPEQVTRRKVAERKKATTPT